jgi:hypothetical protein
LTAARRPFLWAISVNENLTLHTEGWLARFLFKEGSVSYVVLAVLSVALIRLAIAYVYPIQANWDE